LRARLEELGIDYIDLLAEFSIHSLHERLYKKNDTHWNIAGNALAARLISQHLSSQLAQLSGNSRGVAATDPAFAVEEKAAPVNRRSPPSPGLWGRGLRFFLTWG
jgi:hypothetical protein